MKLLAPNGPQRSVSHGSRLAALPAPLASPGVDLSLLACGVFNAWSHMSDMCHLISASVPQSEKGEST